MLQISKKAIATIIISSIAYYFYLRKFFSFYISTSIDIHMILFLCVAYYIYILVTLIVDRRVSAKDGYTLKFMYIIFLITLFFSKDVNTTAGYINTFNLDVTEVSYSLNTNIGLLFIIMNVILLIPVGWLCRKFDVVIKFLFPILLFLIVEYIQYVNGVGVFDINDIILNTVGFYIGTFLFSRIG